MIASSRGTLLHICCAPDATVPWPALASEGGDVIGCFYGSNIHPEGEWRRRRDAVDELARALSMRCVVCEYDPNEWMRKVEGLEDRPEGGERCIVCFELQMRRAASEALRLGCSRMCTTLTISPHKDVDAINRIGRAAAEAAGIEWIERVWRKGGGFAKSVAASREMGLYRQRYCGCIFSIERNEV